MATVGWISDAGRPTGFGRITDELAGRLATVYGHDVHVLAVGWDAASPPTGPLKLYRAEAGPAKHYLGFDRVVPWLMQVQPDVVIVVEEPAILQRRLVGNPYDPKQVLRRYRPVIAYLSVDGYNLPPSIASLTQMSNVVATTRFGQDAFPGSRLAPLGVDPAVFHEVSPDDPIETRVGTITTKAECREMYQIPEDSFVVGRVDTNSGRKDWARQWAVMDRYFNRDDVPDTTSFWHTKRTNPGHGADLEALVSRSRGIGRYFISDRDDWPTGDLVALLNAFDVFLDTSRGEGFGLNPAQALACGVPVIATDCSALTEVVGPGGILVPPEGTWTNPYGVDLKLANVEAMAEALASLANDPERRLELGQAGKRHVLESFNWDVTAEQFHIYIEAFVGSANALLVEQRAAGL